MYTSFRLAKKYTHYYFFALNGKGHGIHSPFVFDFVLYVLNNKGAHQPPTTIERVRQHLLRDKTVLQIQDFGAGSRRNKTNGKTISQLAKVAVKPIKYSLLLYRLVKHYQPQTVIELGTSLGITTAYLAAAAEKAQVITLEGSEAILNKAQQNFDKLSINNIQTINANFDDALPDILHSLKKIDLGYIDGNHRFEPTLAYFRQLLAKSDADTILVFDDIHWSADMEKAWTVIQQHPSVRCTIDIFFLGFVFFCNDIKEKQHFTIRF